MSINMKTAIMAALALGGLGIASAALANDAAPRVPQAHGVGDWTENRGVVDCPTLEGYPDCHPNDRASWGDWAANSRPYRPYFPSRP